MKALANQVQAELKLFLRAREEVFFTILLPLGMVTLFGYLNREGQVGEISYPSFLLTGGIGMVVVSAAIENLGAALARERDDGILKRLGGTPLRVWTLVGAKVLAAAIIILAQALLMIAMGVLFFNAEITGNLLWTIVVLWAGILAFAAMGFALAGLLPNADAASAAAHLIVLPMQFLCDTFFPIEEMPSLLKTIAQMLPLTYFVNALRGALVAGGGSVSYARDWLILLGCLVVFFAIAVRTFRWE